MTGGCGFLGRHVVERLRRSDRIGAVLVADNLDKLCGGVGVGEIEYVDITNADQLAGACAGVDVIVHLAAYGRNLTCQHHPYRAWDVNVNGTLNVLELGRMGKVKRIVCCSSNIVLSDQLTVYKETKQACERLIALYASLGVNCMGLRPSNIYGAGQSKTEYQLCAFAGLDRSYAEHGKFLISGDGTQTRDWVHVADVARAFELALFSEVKGETLDICTGRQTSMNEIAEMLRVSVKYAPARPGDAKTLVSLSGPAEELLGYKAYLSLENVLWDAFPSVSREVSA